MSGWYHEWQVVGDEGRIRFVRCDEKGAPTDRKRFEALQDAASRGELTYLGVIQRTGEEGVDTDARRSRSYADDLIDGAAASGMSLGGDMALFRDN